MSIQLQFILVVLIVAAAASYLARAGWRSWRKSRSSGCGGSCACPGKNSVAGAAKTAHLIPLESLTLRRPPRDNP
jgi:hypothetical protein